MHCLVWMLVMLPCQYTYSPSTAYSWPMQRKSPALSALRPQSLADALGLTTGTAPMGPLCSCQFFEMPSMCAIAALTLHHLCAVVVTNTKLCLFLQPSASSPTGPSL